MKTYITAVILALFSLLIIVSPVHAATFASAANGNGGRIVLTDVPAKDCGKDSFILYARASNGKVIYGCWTFREGEIVAQYDDGSVRIYDLEGWTMGEKYQDKPKQQGNSAPTKPAGKVTEL